MRTEISKRFLPGRIFTWIGALLVILPLFGAGVAGEVERSDGGTVVRIMSFNVLMGGGKLGQPLAQTARVITAGEADVVGLQEIGGKAKELADALGWNLAANGSSAIITRFEILENMGGGVKVRLDSGTVASVFNVHLRPSPYQPYQLLKIPYGNAPFITTEPEAVAGAEKARGDQVAALLKAIGALRDEGSPVFITGDFNEPSHLDWTQAAAERGLHPIKVAYPNSQALTRAGFADAYRAVHPDECGKPGFTWSPLTERDDPKDHHDRIDFVYFKGKGISVKGTGIVGESKEHADIVVAPYPSDHRAVVAAFKVPD